MQALIDQVFSKNEAAIEKFLAVLEHEKFNIDG